MEAWLIVAGCVLAAFVALFGPPTVQVLLQQRAHRRLRRGTPTLVDGEIVTLVGKVRRATKSLTAPLSGRSCVGFESIAYLYEDSGTGLGKRVRSALGSFAARDFCPFELETKDAVVRVEVSAESVLVLTPVPVIPRSLERERAFLEAHGKKASLRDSSFEEITIAVGDTITVQGMAVIEAVPAVEERGYRDVVQRARIVAHPEHPLTIGPP